MEKNEDWIKIEELISVRSLLDDRIEREKEIIKQLFKDEGIKYQINLQDKTKQDLLNWRKEVYYHVYTLELYVKKFDIDKAKKIIKDYNNVKIETTDELKEYIPDSEYKKNKYKKKIVDEIVIPILVLTMLDVSLLGAAISLEDEIILWTIFGAAFISTCYKIYRIIIYIKKEKYKNL